MESADVRYVAYGICVSKQTAHQWSEIIDVLLQKHSIKKPMVFQYELDFNELLLDFRKFKPKYTCFVAEPLEITRDYYNSLHSFVCQIDENSFYSATIFGILTGPDKETALKIAANSIPLNISTVLSNTKINFSPFKTGYTYSEIQKNLMYTKINGETVESEEGPDDIVKNLVDHINKNEVDLMITSAHAKENDWRPAFCYPGGCFKYEKDTNDLIGVDLDKEVHKINSTNPKIYLGCGNCLIANMKPPNCMCLSWMKSANAVQFVGYTVPSWFGFAGWGINKYFIETPARFSLAEAYFANLQVLNYYKNLHDTNQKTDEEFKKGLDYEQNVVILYGDPAWRASICSESENFENLLPYKMTVEEIKPKVWKVEVLCLKDCMWECPIPDDKDTVPGRPPFLIFKERFENKLKVIEGKLELTDLFAMMPLEGSSKKGDAHIAIFMEISEEIVVNEKKEKINKEAEKINTEKEKINFKEEKKINKEKEKINKVKKNAI